MTLAFEQLFTEHRRFLWGLSYRMTGRAADADDVVQDTFVRAIEHPPQRIDEPIRPWLVKVALNLSRDVLRRRIHREYVGPWLPSPVDTGDEASPPSHEPIVDGLQTLEARYDLLESVSLAFLVALERLTPRQRGVLLLRDVFDYSVKETATALDLSEANVKTTHHRARQAMSSYDAQRRVPTAPVQEAHRAALFQFLERLQANDVAGVEALLAEDARTTTDGGGEFRSALRTIVGRDKVARFYLAVSSIGQGHAVRLMMLNGLPAVVIDTSIAPPRVAPRSVMQVALDASGRITHVYVVSATAKLTGIVHA
ncbi:MAG TPA: sigma-70 family RNA polymerase sigma factor [Vicinamibacterales bacterium]|jgi:RNA polymerase sigma-70 factor (ECF subfamily)|nr:sigma-70 family RNA polymerase sigma factor [Vicinamibacterales bacterium]